MHSRIAILMFLFWVTALKVTDDTPLLRTVPEVAKLLRKGESTVWRMIANGEIEAVRSGGSTRIRTAEVERYVKSLEPVSG